MEYHDNPGLRYGEGIDIVLDYITIKRTSGGNLGVDLSHQLNTFWMADYIYGKYNRGRSEFSLSSFANVHRYKEAWQDRKEIFHTPDGTFQRTQEGIPGRDYEMYWTTTANYNYTKDKHLLSLFGRCNVDEAKCNSVNLAAMGFPNDNMDNLLFGKKYLYILGASFVIAIPLVYYIIDDYTKDFAVKAPIGAGIFVSGFILTLLVSLGTLLWQVRKAVRINPALIMKSE